jgi:cytochrome c oxidase subunit 2
MQRRLVLKSLCLVLFGAGLGASQAAVAEPRRIAITAKRFAFDPNVITLRKGESVKLVLESLDVVHGLRCRELGLELKASKGKPGEALITPNKIGDFVGHCSVFCGAGHGSMTLTLRVVA